jgi:hypothetical protein
LPKLQGRSDNPVFFKNSNSDPQGKYPVFYRHTKTHVCRC